jgi:hypothetical protein
MRRFLPALIVVVAGLLSLPGPTLAQGRSHDDRPVSVAERKRRWGEMLVLGIIAGGIGATVVVKGTREFVACLPKGRRSHAGESQF